MVSMQTKLKQITYKIQASKPKLARSVTWSTVRRHHLQKQPECQACGSKQKLEVHHIIPTHVDKTKELDPNNLLTLCENPATGFCHYIFGHLSLSWWKYNLDVIEEAENHKQNIDIAKTTQDARGKSVTDGMGG